MRLAADPETLYPVALQRRVERYLSEELPFAAVAGTERLVEAMRYSLLAPAKRVRPVLALATAGALGHDPDEVLPLAAAIEMIHTYSLIHDDLPAMDDDDLRRGQPTCHVAYGEDVAILAGDCLFAEAVALVLREQIGPPQRVLAALRELIEATGLAGMVGGQFLDVSGAAESGEIERLARMHSLKTGALIAASVGSVLTLVGQDGPATMPYRAFAAELGLLFQIVDDILDVSGNEQQLGKRRGSDQRLRKITYVTAHGLEGARRLAAETHERALAQLARAPGETAELRRIADYVLARQR
ncbi:polyprenyl synthetase family protein [Thermoleophilum album]|uniref:Geranylgeranyl diphosphate synthase, type II n=1 Tax=Thermoleophilum album TaxID=29539 RepID=A0A1H6FTH1_THEAL|nr:farnesyl diphosphate synthase [Thermoleophilum album]SEH14161.1 geranylgeranyl diphosphate synthase, type II [Thermoleophilum album]